MKKMFMVMMVMVVMVMASCTKDFDNLSKSTLPQVPNDVEMTWRAIGNKDSVRVIYKGGSFVAAAPRMQGGNTYMRQGTQGLEATSDSPATCGTTSASVVFAHNYGINDTINVDLGIDVVVMRWNPATGETELSNEKVYPAEKMGLFENIEKTHPQEATGFYEINAMRYTLAEISNPSLYAGKVSSKATIFELSSDTVIVHDTVVVTDTVNGGDTPTDPTVISRNVYWRHMHDCGQWTGTGNTRTISGHCWCVEETNWSNNTTSKDSVLVAWNGTMTWNFPTYDHNVDGNYNASANGCSALQATASVSYNYGVANIQGRTYTHGTACGPVPTAVNVVGTTATVTTTANNILREAVYSLTIVVPTPADTINIFDGEMVYYAITASYRNSAQSSNDVDWFVNVVVLDGGSYKVYYSPLASTAAGLNFTFKGTITSAEFSNLTSVSNFTAAAESGNRRGLAMAYHHNDNSILDITTVKYSSGTSQVKYYSLNGALHSAHSAIGQTLGNVSSEEPVREGGVKTGNGIFTFVYGGAVIK